MWFGIGLEKGDTLILSLDSCLRGWHNILLAGLGLAETRSLIDFTEALYYLFGEIAP